MKTLKRIEIAILVIGFLVLGTSYSFAQHKYSGQNSIAPPSSAIAQPPVSSIQPKGDILDNNTGMPILYLSAGADAQVCKTNSFALSGINTTKGKVMWETSGDGKFNNPYSLNAVYFPGNQDKAMGEVMLTLSIIDPNPLLPYKFSDSMVLILENCGLVDPDLED